jgi:hypothetical protein
MKIQEASVLPYVTVSIKGLRQASTFYDSSIEMLYAGVPDTAVDAGFEHSAMAQIERFGYINDPKMRMTAAVRITPPGLFPTPK